MAVLLPTWHLCAADGRDQCARYAGPWHIRSVFFWSHVFWEACECELISKISWDLTSTFASRILNELFLWRICQRGGRKINDQLGFNCEQWDIKWVSYAEIFHRQNGGAIEIWKEYQHHLVLSYVLLPQFWASKPIGKSINLKASKQMPWDASSSMPESKPSAWKLRSQTMAFLFQVIAMAFHGWFPVSKKRHNWALLHLRKNSL